MILEHYSEPSGRSVYRLSIEASELAGAAFSQEDVEYLRARNRTAPLSEKLLGLVLIAQRIEGTRLTRDLERLVAELDEHDRRFGIDKLPPGGC